MSISRRVLSGAAAFAMLAIGSAEAFDLEAHRGGRGLMPENTLPAFAHALALGVDTLELDVALTKDNILVISHDPMPTPKLARYQGAFIAEPAPPIYHLTYKELKKYDVGRINPDDPTYKQFSRQQPMDGIKIPKLAELFDLVKRSGNETVRFNIETKLSPTEPNQTPGPDEFAEALVKAVRDAGMARRTMIQSFDWRSLRHVQAIAPEIETVYLSSSRTVAPGSPWTAGYDLNEFKNSVPRMVKAAGGAVWSPFYRNLTDADLKVSKEIGLKVVVWTVNDPADMSDLIRRGVDGIITDYPDVLRGVLAERSMKLPRPTVVVP